MGGADLGCGLGSPPTASLRAGRAGPRATHVRRAQFERGAGLGLWAGMRATALWPPGAWQGKPPPRRPPVLPALPGRGTAHQIWASAQSLDCTAMWSRTSAPSSPHKDPPRFWKALPKVLGSSRPCLSCCICCCQLALLHLLLPAGAALAYRLAAAASHREPAFP